jgi:hypothetical protein
MLAVAATQNGTGIIRVTFSLDAEPVYQKVLDEVCPVYAALAPPATEHSLAALFREASARRGGGTWVPTVVAEVDRGSTDKVVENVAKALKRLGSDSKSCRAVLVMSDANAAFALPKDDARIELIWVDDFSETEAHAFLNQTDLFPLGIDVLEDGTDANALKRQRVFDVAGTRPARLLQLVAKMRGGASLEEYLETVMRDARDVLGRLTKPDASMTSPSAEDMVGLVRALLASPSSSVPAVSFTSVLSKPDKVAPLLKDYHALLYHYETKSYRFYSPAFRLAALEMFGPTSGSLSCPLSCALPPLPVFLYHLPPPCPSQPSPQPLFQTTR